MMSHMLLAVSCLKLFADDSNLFVISDSIEKLFKCTNDELCATSDWLNANKLYGNYEKTNFMIFQHGMIIIWFQITSIRLCLIIKHLKKFLL